MQRLVTLSRQTDSGEAGPLSEERAELYATQLISYAAQAKSAVDQMVFSGARIGELDFIDPSDANFNAGTQKDRTNRVFHPEGGGLVKGRLPNEVTDQTSTTPVAGWYLGRFNNVEWTRGTDDDVILVAYQISQDVCGRINDKIKGSSAIPVVGTALKTVFIDGSFHVAGNVDLTTDPSGSPLCADCHEIASLCVSNAALTEYAFYSVIADQ